MVDKKKVLDFVERWTRRGYEKGEAVSFWKDLLYALGYSHWNDPESVLYEHRLSSGGFIDAWLRDASTIVEQKALAVDLDKPEPRQGKMKTPLEQALDYVDELPRPEQPRFVVTCNFETFRVHDRDRFPRSQLAGNAFEFTLSELADHPEYLSFIVDPSNSRLEKEKKVSIKAGELVGKLYDRMREGYIDPDSEESMHALNVLCVRLVFCLYCEDADLFPKDAFLNYLRDVPPENIRMNLKRLFSALNTPIEERDPYDLSIKPFPYVNGGLFREEAEIPNFDAEMKRFLLDDVSAPVDWSQISPTIFGGIFESTLNPESRRSGGMHYTSPENIHKVIDPLFLDNLKAEFIGIRDAEGLTPRQKKNRYAALHDKMCGLKFFDPACGSGNFLTETYICLRKLEDAVLRELRGGQTGFGFTEDEDAGIRVSLNQFYGIEINDFAVTVAESALWISRLKANGETSMFLSFGDDDFPLHERASITHANALRTDWNDVLPADECSYIMGNPPFYGGKLITPRQREEIRALFGKIPLVNSIDYVSGWYMKACSYMNMNTAIRAALVSTNSITQGEQVFPVWNTLMSKFSLHINFAWRTFIWDSEASEKAHVHVIIIGFSVKEEESIKTIFEEQGSHTASHINPYLVDGPDAIVEVASTPISNEAPECDYGSLPNEGGNYIFKSNELEAFLNKEPDARQFVRPFYGANEFIKNKPRYVLYLRDITDEQLAAMPYVRERVEAVRELRRKSTAEATRKTAEWPERFYHDATSESDFVLIPAHSSERRRYIPIGFCPAICVASNAVSVVKGATLYHFGILTSQFHNAWMRTVCGRLESRYRYSPKTVYNTFIWPDSTPEQRRIVETCAQMVLDSRGRYPAKSLADLYDPDKMPTDLLSAHKALDMAVEAAYGVDFGGDEEKIVAHLFKLYAEKTKPSQGKKSGKARKRSK